MAIQAQVPIVPVAISGGRAAMRKGSAIVRPVRVSVRVGQPIPTAGLTLDDRDALIARVRAAGRAAAPGGLHMELAVALGRTSPFALAAGVNVYATVALIGLAVRFGWVDLPPQYEAFASDIVIGAAVVLYVAGVLRRQDPLRGHPLGPGPHRDSTGRRRVHCRDVAWRRQSRRRRASRP